jgi:anti-sigma factor RsiW
MRLRFEPHDAAGQYADNALSKTERRSFEVHAARCRRCRTDVDCLIDIAATFALVVEPVDPPPSLRGRILDAVRAEGR